MYMFRRRALWQFDKICQWLYIMNKSYVQQDMKTRNVQLIQGHWQFKWYPRIIQRMFKTNKAHMKISLLFVLYQQKRSVHGYLEIKQICETFFLRWNIEYKFTFSSLTYLSIVVIGKGSKEGLLISFGLTLMLY